MSTSFGKEVGLIHEVLIQSKKYGADETLWKSFIKDIQFLVHTIDYAAFYHGTRVQIVDGDKLRTIVFVCFAQTDWDVGQEEVVSRVERFGRFATDEELKLACAKLQALWDTGDCPNLQFPIVACNYDDMQMHSLLGEQYFWAITYGLPAGRPTLSKLDSSKQRLAYTTFHWPPGTTFAVVCDKHPSVVSFDRCNPQMK